MVQNLMETCICNMNMNTHWCSATYDSKMQPHDLNMMRGSAGTQAQRGSVVQSASDKKCKGSNQHIVGLDSENNPHHTSQAIYSAVLFKHFFETKVSFFCFFKWKKKFLFISTASSFLLNITAQRHCNIPNYKCPARSFVFLRKYRKKTGLTGTAGFLLQAVANPALVIMWDLWFRSLKLRFKPTKLPTLNEIIR